MPHRPSCPPSPAPSVLLVLVGSGVLSGCVVAGGTNAGSGRSGGGGFFFFLLPLLIIAFVMMRLRGRMRSGSRRSAGRHPEPAGGSDRANEQLIRAELSVLADDVLRYEPQVALHDAARNDFESAVHRYRVAQAAIDHATEQVDLVRVQRVVDEATWSMSRATAIVQGRPPPEPPAKLQTPGQRGEPAVRIDAEDRPQYVGAPVSFQSGWFGGGGGLLGGLMMGSMLGGFGGFMTSHEWVDEDMSEYPDDSGQ